MNATHRPLPRHQIAALTLAPEPHAGYLLGGVAYGLAPAWARRVEAVARAHAGVLGLRELRSEQTPELEARAVQAARVYAAQGALLEDRPLTADERQALRSHFAEWPAEAARAGALHIATDGSRQKAGSGGPWPWLHLKWAALQRRASAKPGRRARVSGRAAGDTAGLAAR